jgi:hypothetical protein
MQVISIKRKRLTPSGTRSIAGKVRQRRACAVTEVIVHLRRGGERVRDHKNQGRLMVKQPCSNQGIKEGGGWWTLTAVDANSWHVADFKLDRDKNAVEHESSSNYSIKRSVIFQATATERSGLHSQSSSPQ